jgi:hypothetical protein
LKEQAVESEDQSPKTVDEALDDLKARAQALDHDIHKAEEKHPPPIDHADDGGVV